MSTLSGVVDDLVAANRILAGLRVLDGFGHVSVRQPDRADRFLLARSLAPELVTRDDIMTFDLTSAPQDGDTRTPYLERFIHGEIFVQRPDVICVVHSHAATVVPFAASSVPLQPIYHMSSFLRTGAPVGGSIPEGVFRAYYAQLNADLQQRAIALGGRVTYREDDEARLYDETNRSVIGRPWGLWKAKFAPKE